MVVFQTTGSPDIAMTGDTYLICYAFSIVGAVGLISIHLAFYQMNPWPTALSRILNLWNPHEFDSGRNFLYFCLPLPITYSSFAFPIFL